MSAIVLEQVNLSFGARPIVEDLSLRVDRGDRLGLIGANGSGKSTLLRLISGEQHPDSGVVRSARGVRVGWLPQDIVLETEKGLLDFVVSSVPGRHALENILRETEEAYERATALYEKDPTQEQLMIEEATRLSELHEEITRFDAHYSEYEARAIMSGLGFKTEDYERSVKEFSGGWKMRALLGSLLFQRPDVLLLDEPTNHLDMPSVAWFSDFLKNYGSAFVLISHDREFLNEQISRIVSFEVEGVRQYPGNYERYLTQRAEEEEILENKAKNLERERAHAEEFIGRFRAQATKAKAVQSRIKALDKMEHVETYRKRRTMRFSFPEPERAGHEVIKIDEVAKSYGERVVLPSLTSRVYRGDRIGIVGPNGAGKTTLLKLVAGELAPTSGSVSFGNNVTVGYYAQHHADLLHPKNTVLQEVANENRELGQTRVRSVLGAFLFSGDDVDKNIGVLSGGERARVALARLLVSPGNLLLLDEPTNHLDLDSCESLIESLHEYAGTMLFVSHNRALIRRLATKIWEVEGGRVTEYAGSLDDYLLRERARKTATVASAKSESARADGSNDKERKRREATAREKRNKVLVPLQKRIADLEAAIQVVEVAQAARNELLSSPSATLSDKEKFRALDDLQGGQRELDTLSARWEKLMTELADAEQSLDVA